MAHRFLELANTPSVKAEQARHGSRDAYSRQEGGAATHDTLSPTEAAFIAARDSFYIATASETGWPYIQHRGGPQGFLKVLDPHTLGFADYRGNRQYISLGNVSVSPRISLFLMDYPNQRRLKLLGRMTSHDLRDNPDLAARLADTSYSGRPERLFTIAVEAFDWNCPQHITPRYTEAELHHVLEPVRDRIAALKAENLALQTRLDAALQQRSPGAAHPA